MITDLAQMKMFLPVPAFTAGLSIFLFLYFAVCLLPENIKLKKPRTETFYDVCLGEDADTSRYERIIRTEALKYTWYYSVTETVSVLGLTATVLFHGRIIDMAGISLFIPACLIPALTAVLCFLMKKRWKSAVCDNLISCITLYTGAAGDLHAGIRMMLSVKEIDIPMTKVLEKIQNDNPGMSGSELMKRTGYVLRSEKICSYFRQPDKPEKGEANSVYPERFNAYSSGFGIFSFGIILLLCLLINF